MFPTNVFMCILIVLLRRASSDAVKIDDRSLNKDSLYGCNFINKQLKCTCPPALEKIFILEENSTPVDVKTIEIKRCNNVMIGFNAIRQKTKLRTIILSNISNLILENHSIYRDWSKNNSYLSVLILNANISNIRSHSFRGISQIIFKNATINTISPYAFSSITNMESIRFFKTEISKIKSHAFYKLSTKHLIVNGCKFENLSSDSFSNINVKQNFYIKQSNISNVSSNAFTMHYVKTFVIRNSNLISLKSQAFKIRTESVSFEKVTFFTSPSDILSGIRRLIETQYYPEKASFELNSVVFKSCSREVLRINQNSFDVKLINTFFQHENNTNCSV